MKKNILLFCFTLLFFFVHHKLLANREIKGVTLLTSEVVQYEKVEFDIQLTGAFTNPYDQQDIRLDAIFTAPSGESLVLPCYYLSGDETGSLWKARFAPQESGIYQFRVEVKKAETLESTLAGSSFDVTASAKNGFLHAGNHWTFEFDSGIPFRGVGENMAWEPRTWEPEQNTYDYFLPKYAQNGVNFFRTWMSGWNLPLEWKRVGDTDRYTNSDSYFNPGAIERMDELVEMADSLGLYMMLALEWHGHVSPGAWWERSNYNAANGGPATNPTEFFTLDASRAQFKNRLRYIVARWGYSTSIAAWEFFNEIDNAVSASGIPHSAITSWHTEMGKYMADIDPYDHLMTTSISHTEITGLKTIPEIDFNQKHIYRNTGSIPSTLTSYVNSTGKPYVIGEFGYEWDWNVDFDPIEEELVFDYKRGLWYGLFNPTPILPMSWWWEWFDPRGTNSYFAAVQEISQKMLEAGKGSFEPQDATVSGLESYAVKAGSTYFVYLLNNSTSAVQNKEVQLKVLTHGTYTIQLFDPEKRTYSEVGDVLATNLSLSLPALSFRERESKILLISPTASTEGSQSPFRGEALPIPGKIEAEDFDLGGEGIAYHELEAENTGGAYRNGEGVDIKNSIGEEYYVSNVVLGEWLEYSAEVQTAGTYLLEVKVAAAEAGKNFRIELNGRTISGIIEIPNTGGMESWETVAVQTPILAEGLATLRVYASSSAFSLDFLRFTLVNQAPTISLISPVEGDFFQGSAKVEMAASAADEDGSVAKVAFYSGNTLLAELTETPYSFSWEAPGGDHVLTAQVEDNDGLVVSSPQVHIKVDDRIPYTPSGEPHLIPGKIEAEDFDRGSAGMVYHDLTPGNTFGEYRPDSDVDIEASTDEGGGFNLGDFQAGEWVEYTLLVEEEGSYDISFRMATQSSGQYFHLESGGNDITGRIAVPNTGGWQSWKDVEVKNISLSAGKQVLRLVAETEFFNVDYMTFMPSSEVTGIKHGFGLAAALVHPNPSKNYFTLQLKKEPGSIKVLSMEGRTVFFQENPTKSLFSFGEQFMPGLYLVLVQYRNGDIEVQRVVKMN